MRYLWWWLHNTLGIEVVYYNYPLRLKDKCPEKYSAPSCKTCRRQITKFKHIANSVQIEITKINSYKGAVSSDDNSSDDEDNDEDGDHSKNENIADFLTDIPTPTGVDQDKEASAVTDKGEWLI